METTNKIKRSELWNKIYAIVNQIPRKNVDGDAMDAASATTEIEFLIETYNAEVLTENSLIQLGYEKVGFTCIQNEYGIRHNGNRMLNRILVKDNKFIYLDTNTEFYTIDELKSLLKN